MQPFVSVIVPCRNEARFLAGCLDSILGSDYPAQRMEVIVADGLSDDGTREVIESYAERDSRVRLVDNPGRITPVALNRALEAARGEVIARLDARGEMAPDYLSRCVESLAATGADNVGGVRLELPQEPGAFAGPIVAALTHPFGVGNAHYRFGASQLRYVDTVFGGCWKREVFERIGTFNERLCRSQDLEFNQRLRRAGGKVVLVPGLVTRYYTRSRLGRFSRHNWTNGVWAVLPFAYSDGIPVGWRHLAPLTFVGTSVLLCAAPLVRPEIRWAPAIVLLPYAALNLGVSCQLARRKRSWRYLALMPVTFASLHLSYGAGSVWGAACLAAIQIQRILGIEARNHTRYSTVTEQPRQYATRTQMAMLATRYGWAVKYAAGKNVLEVACGAGLGLGCLARTAATVEAGDFDETNCRVAESTYRANRNIHVHRMDASALPFGDAFFDLMLLFEAIYYLPDAARSLREAYRVLRPRGTLLVSTVNREWAGFNPSPLHTRYFSAAELRASLAACGFEKQLFAGFPDSPSAVVGALRRAAIAAGCVPRTMRGKAFLKRLLYGPLARIPSQIEPKTMESEALVPLDHGADLTRYRVLYAAASKHP